MSGPTNVLDPYRHRYARFTFLCYMTKRAISKPNFDFQITKKGSVFKICDWISVFKRRKKGFGTLILGSQDVRQIKSSISF